MWLDAVIPKCVAETIAALRAERPAIAAQLDAIDLALDNLLRAWPGNGQAPKKLGGARSADDRRARLLTVIGQSDGGLSLAELRQATPTMRGKDRSNTLHRLKMAKQIRRAGKKWIAT